jgi:hypothetical protein
MIHLASTVAHLATHAAAHDRGYLVNVGGHKVVATGTEGAVLIVLFFVLLIAAALKAAFRNR